MIVIADATPLHYLIINRDPDILKTLYGRIIIPEAVCRELQALRTPDAIKRWMASPPPWIEVRHVALGKIPL
jgi:predicted nucleic acid-binding protein